VLLAVWLPGPRQAGGGAAENQEFRQEEPPPEGPEPAVRFPDRPLHRDFDLKVEIPGAGRNRLGERLLREGDAVMFRVEVDRDAYVGIWTIAPDNTWKQLFPNEHDPDHKLRAHQAHNVPDPGRCWVKAILSEGTERIWVRASTEFWEPRKGQGEGGFRTFKTEQDRKELVRTLEVRPGPKEGNPALAEEVLTYRVLPRNETGHK
jgi:hypothetical protein